MAPLRARLEKGSGGQFRVCACHSQSGLVDRQASRSVITDIGRSAADSDKRAGTAYVRRTVTGTGRSICHVKIAVYLQCALWHIKSAITPIAYRKITTYR